MKPRFQFQKKKIVFSLSKMLFKTQIIKSLPNERVKDHEKLNYQLTVIKDQFLTINANYAPDSLKVDKFCFGSNCR
jgi:hypothetical protein